MDSRRDELGNRFLVLALTSKDVTLAQSILGRAGMLCVPCRDLEQVCEHLEEGAAAVLLVEETITQPQNCLTEWLARQPPWSDVPVLVMARPGADSTAVAQAMDLSCNVVVLERPTRVAALVSAARTALRSRQRQYQIREMLAQSQGAAEELRQRVEELTTLMDTLPVGVFIAHDPDCGRITGNRAAAELLRTNLTANLSRTAPSGERLTHFRVCKDGVEIPPAELPVQRAARGEPVRNEAVDQVFDDGTVTRTLVSASPVFRPDGRLRGAVAAILDVTEQKRVEEALREADRRKDEFLATLAHELRNPLAPIRNSLHILRLAGRQDPATDRVSEMMERQVNHMVRLVDDLLEVSRITRGKIDLRKELVEVAAVIRNAVETSRPLVDAGDHRLVLALPPEPLSLVGDPVRLAQVFANLLNNAAKYTDRGGKIEMTVRRDGEAVAVSVRDSGTGIEPEMLPRVFDMFSQIDRNSGRAQGGLGIGLTLVKRLVEMHGGSVRAHSDGLGRGSEFVVRLPLAARQSRAEPAATTPEQAGLAAARRVLVVDDNRDAAESLAMLLKLLGVEVRVALSGREALEAMPVYKPAVVLLDIGMPGMDGYEVARRIRQQPELGNIMLIALTGWAQEEDRHRTQSAGFDYHLVKPGDIKILQTLLMST